MPDFRPRLDLEWAYRKNGTGHLHLWRWHGQESSLCGVLLRGDGRPAFFLPAAIRIKRHLCQVCARRLYNLVDEFEVTIYLPHRTVALPPGRSVTVKSRQE